MAAKKPAKVTETKHEVMAPDPCGMGSKPMAGDMPGDSTPPVMPKKKGKGK